MREEPVVPSKTQQCSPALEQWEPGSPHSLLGVCDVPAASSDLQFPVSAVLLRASSRDPAAIVSQKCLK